MSPALTAFAGGALAIACIAFSGCTKAPHKAAAPALVEVIEDPCELDKARAAWKALRDERLAYALSHPASIRSFEPEILELVRADRPQSIAALECIVADVTRPPGDRMHAELARRFLDVPVDPQKLQEIAGLSPDAACALLTELSDLFPEPSPLPAELRRFVIASLDAPDTPTRDSALLEAAQRGYGEAAMAIQRRMEFSSQPDRTLLLAVSKLSPTEHTLRAIESLLASDSGFAPGPALQMLGRVGINTCDIQLRRKVAEIGTRHLLGRPDHPSIEPESIAAVRHLVMMGPAGEAENRLSLVAEKARNALIRKTALDELNAFRAAIAAVSTNPGHARDEADTANGSDQPSESVWAGRCVEAGLLTRSQADAALASASPGDDASSSDFSKPGALGILSRAGRAIGFDLETGRIPNRHDWLILDFARASSGTFRPEAVREDVVEPGAVSSLTEAGYVVEFIHAGRLYRIRPRNFGDWYDVEAVIAVIHRALEDAGVPERFVSVYEDGQYVWYLLGRPETIAAAAGKLGLSIATDSERARAN